MAFSCGFWWLRVGEICDLVRDTLHLYNSGGACCIFITSIVFSSLCFFGIVERFRFFWRTLVLNSKHFQVQQSNKHLVYSVLYPFLSVTFAPGCSPYSEPFDCVCDLFLYYFIVYAPVQLSTLVLYSSLCLACRVPYLSSTKTKPREDAGCIPILAPCSSLVPTELASSFIHRSASTYCPSMLLGVSALVDALSGAPTAHCPITIT